MKRPQQWTWSAILAFTIVFAMYIPIAYFGYVVYGTSLKESIITSIQSPLIQQAANLFIAAHCILTLTIVINPLNQEMEHLLKIPHHFGWQRVAIRTTTLLSIVFCAETVPSFGPILNLIGGTCVALTSAILPNMFYLFLHAQDDSELNVDAKYKDTPKIPSIKDVIQRAPFTELVINCAVIALAIICGIATTYSALLELATSNFSSPCYLSTSNDAQAITSDSAMFHIQCCGSGNVSRLGVGPDYCPSIV
ncbi:transmembrane amino acid transporter protein domain-containing protein [Ditylenchus destructor]|uniref:Transmembrane amino acid transporter protein domain-containing protein n=1 Tax=Ditylenchus destructor TaxID=166010 RepID=A0AAD4R6I5_9BILA|nr:transmembrane amino acid transporter protein domain-containing protein [Ditylenchus destructor]